MVFPWFSYGFPMVFLWFSYGFPMVFPWFSYGFPMVFLWFSHGFPMVFLWFSYGFPMVFLWFSYGFPRKIPVIFHCASPGRRGRLRPRGRRRACAGAAARGLHAHYRRSRWADDWWLMDLDDWWLMVNDYPLETAAWLLEMVSDTLW